MSFNVINPFQTFKDTTGAVRSAGIITFFENKTTTPASIFSDEALTIAQSNPYTLDASGRITGDVKFSGKLTLQITNSDLSDVRTDDDVTTIADSSDVLRTDLANTSDITKGVALVGQSVQIISTKAVAKGIPPILTRNIWINDTDGGLFKAVTGAAPGTYSDNGAAFCGTQFIPTGGDGSSAWLRVDGGGNVGLTFNIIWFGAQTSLASNSSALQLTINATPASDASKVKIPTGDWKFLTEVTPKSNLWIDGDAEATFLDFSGAVAYANLFEFSNAQIDDIRFTNMRIRGQGDNSDVSKLTQGCAIRLNSGTKIERIKIQNVRFERFHLGVKIDMTGGFNEAPEVTNCWFDEISYASIDFRNARSPLVSGNTFDLDRTGVGDAVDGIIAVWMAAGATGDPNNTLVRVIGNTVYGGSGECINIQASSATIIGNTIETSAPDAIMFEPTVQTSPTAAEVEQISVIANNTISLFGDRGITVRSDPANNTRASTHIDLIGNVIANGIQGMRIGWATDTTSGPLEIGLTGNSIYNTTGAGAVFQGISGLSLTGLKVINSGLQGLNFIDCDDVSIAGGRVKGSGATSDCIVFDNTDDVIMTGVGVLNAGRYGVEIVNGSNNITIDANMFEDNQGVPTMDNAVHVLSGTNIKVTSSNTVNGVTGDIHFGLIIQSLDNTGTPSVQNFEDFLTGGTTAITDFINGFVGQHINILSEHTITITDGTNIFLNGSANYSMTTSDSLSLIQKADGNWYELSRSVN